MGITMGTCKTKAIQIDLSISTHILTCSGIIRHIWEIFRAYLGNIQAYLGIIRTLCNSGIFRNLTYLVLIAAPLEKKWQPRGAWAREIEFSYTLEFC